MKKSIAKKANHNFENGPYEKLDKNGNVIYFEKSDGFWSHRKYDYNNNRIYYENSLNFWEIFKFNDNSKMIYYETSTGFVGRY